MAKWFKSDFKGVRYRKHSTRKHGVQFDRYFILTYKLDGKTKSEAVGWASEGNKASEAYDLLNQLKKNRKSGQGPRTLEALRAERQRADKSDAAKMVSLDDYWADYYEYAKRTKKMSSATKEESHYRIWLSPLLGKVLIREIGMLQWDLLVEALSKAKRSKRMKEYVTGTLRRILKHAYHRGMIDQPPPTGKRIGATGPGNSNRRLRVIAPTEAEAIIQKLKKDDVNAWRITKFAFLTGARASECFNLRWRDIDRSRRQITFPETKNRDARVIVITDSIASLFDEMPPCPIDAHVFVKKDGAPYKEAPYSFRTVVEDFKLNEGRSERDRISFHSIRHSVATELAKTLNPRDLMDVMGWRTVQMAMRYVHGNKKAQESAMDRLENAMKPKKAGTVIPLRKNEGVKS